jgi:hypothetical protein
MNEKNLIDNAKVLDAIFGELDFEWPNDFRVSWCFQVTLKELKKAKPNDKSELDRRYAITITEFEKVIAYFDYYVFRDDHSSSDD